MMRDTALLPSPLGMTRDEITELLMREEYGFLPPAPSRVLARELSREEGFCAGKAPLVRLELTCEAQWGSFSFPVSFVCPRADEPLPCFIHINFRDCVPDRYMPTEEIADSRCAVLSFCYEDVCADNADFTDGLALRIYPGGARGDTDCGKIGLWAWAAMRVMDYAVTLPSIRRDRIAVVGHSRLGKTALLTGALDTRFFCAISNDSGCSGAALSRGSSGERIEDICRVFPYWFCKNYAAYAAHEERLRFDQHFLLAAIAPRRVYVASAEGDAWACPGNEYAACAAADEYYRSMGVTGFVHPPRAPHAGDSFHEGSIAYHMRAGTHYLSREDWREYIEYMQRYL